VQLREATVLVQALYRGRRARRLLPKYRREKVAREVSFESIIQPTMVLRRVVHTV